MKNPTKEDIANVDLKKSLSPAVLGDEKIKLIRCSNGYWVMDSKGEYLKDNKKNLKVIIKKKAIEARAKYELNFQDEIKELEAIELENLILKEVSVLELTAKKITKEHLNGMEMILLLSGKSEQYGMHLGFILQKTKWEEDGTINERVEEAKTLANEDGFSDQYKYIKNIYDNEEYNEMYIMFLQNGLPEIASFNNDSKTLIENFHASNIKETIKDISEKSHIYMVAKFNVLKSKEK